MTTQNSLITWSRQVTLNIVNGLFEIFTRYDIFSINKNYMNGPLWFEVICTLDSIFLKTRTILMVYFCYAVGL